MMAREALSISDVLASPSSRLVWLVELTLLDPATGMTEVRRFASEGWTSAVDDPDGEHYYEGMLEVSRLEWSRHDGTAVSGSSSINTATLRIYDLPGRHDDISARRLVADGQPATLRVGSPEMHLGEMAQIEMLGRSIYEVSDGMGFEVQLDGIERVFDRPLSRSTYWGLGRCVQLGVGAHLRIDDADVLHHDASTSFLVEAIVALDTVASAHAVAWRGPTNSADWDLQHLIGGGLRFRAVDKAGATHQVSWSGGDPLIRRRISAGWWDGSIRLWVDGEEVAAAPWAGPPRVTDGYPITIGATEPGGRPLSGRVDDVRVWTTAPSEDEIRASAQRQLDPDEDYPGLALWLPCDEGIGTTCYDESGGGHHAAHSGAVEWSHLGEGEPEQYGLPRPLALGRIGPVPGTVIERYLGGGTRQLHDGPVRGLGPVTEGGAPLGRRVAYSQIPITMDGDTLTVTDATVDVAGLAPGQWVEISGTPSDDGIYRVRRAGLRTLRLFRTSRSSVTATIDLSTVGWSAGSTDISIDSGAREIQTAGAVDLEGLVPGQLLTVSGAGAGAAAGTYTVASASTSTAIRVVESIATIFAGGQVDLDAEELWAWEGDEATATVDLRYAATHPIAIEVRGDVAPDDSFPQEPGALMLRVAQHWAEQSALLYDEPAFDALDSLPGATYTPAGLWLSSEEDPAALQVLDQIATSAGASWGPSLETGSIEAARLDAPGAPALTLDHQTQLFSLTRANAQPPISEQSVLFRRSRVVLADGEIAGAVLDGSTDGQLDRLRQEYLEASAVVDEDLVAAHPAAQPGAVLQTLYATRVGATAFAQWLYDRDSIEREAFTAQMPLMLLVLALRRAAVELISPDFGSLAAGKAVRLLHLSLDGREDRVEATFWG
ncbi:MAG: LamG-like jellyroll fold domain-containing protein [Acidobacteriota bacterium]